MAVAVHLDNVCKSFGENRVVDHISLTIQPGELFFLLGPSGCGKTTLLRCLAGFYIPEAGRIRFNDEDITNLPPEKRDTGMVFQSYALWPHLTVAENVAFGLELRKVAKDEVRRRVDEALAMVRMADRASYKPNQLSGGQQQRIALARALVIKPKCLLLDEPLSNLDAKLRLEMRTEIRRICKQAGLTAVYVTHDQKEALSVADRLAILDRGSIQQCGTPQEVYLHPTSTFVANFIGETNFLPGTVRRASPGYYEVDTVGGPLISTAEPPEALQAGDRVTVSLRPETLHVGTQPRDEHNVWPARVHDTLYLGELAQHQVRVGPAGSEHDLKVFELNPKIVTHDDEVKQTHLWVRTQNVILLKR
jgi:iron(III) transport system ATP-binding protein